MKRKVNILVNMLQEKKLTLALAESVTAGLAAYSLTTVKGVTNVFMGSIACYHPSVKTCLLKVSERDIARHSPESHQVTKALVKGLSRLVEADLYAAVTGLASDGGSETSAKPVGTIFLCVLYKGRFYRDKMLFRGSPLQIKKKACEALFKKLIEVVS